VFIIRTPLGIPLVHRCDVIMEWNLILNTIPYLPGLVREVDLLEWGYGGGREKQMSRERLIKIAGPFLNF